MIGKGGEFRRVAAVATILTSLALAGAARAEEPDESTEPEEAAPARQPEPTPAAAAPAPAPAAAPSGEAFIEHMGPETYPGRLRGIYGGSLWMEPDFQGLQWPQNTRTGLGVSGNFWIDSGWETIRREKDVLPNTTMWLQQGRGVLRLTPAYVSGNWFAQAQVELVGNLCQATNPICLTSGTFSTDDLFVRAGVWNVWDVKFGRFEGWEVYHLGLGMDQYTIERLGAGMYGVDPMTMPTLEVPTFYGVNFLQYRPADGFAVGNVALHLYPTDSLRFELLARLGSDTYRGDNATGDTPWTYYGGRPTIIFDLGWFKLRLGGEYQKRVATTQTIEPGTPPHKKDNVAERVQKGAGASVQFVIDPIVEFGVNAAIGKQDDSNGFGQPVPENTFTVKTVGGFANVRCFTERLLFGAGANWTTRTDAYLASGSTANDFVSHLQGFVALQWRPLGQLYIKGEVGLARAGFLPSDLTVAEWHNYMVSPRLRLLYIY